MKIVATTYGSSPFNTTRLRVYFFEDGRVDIREITYDKGQPLGKVYHDKGKRVERLYLRKFMAVKDVCECRFLEVIGNMNKMGILRGITIT